MLAIENLHVYYGEIHALKGISLTVGQGEIVALLGPNGHGKSTLLKAISGFHPATGGSISFLGRDVSSLPAHAVVSLGIAYIPEERYLFGDMTVLENLRMGAYPFLANGARVRERSSRTRRVPWTRGAPRGTPVTPARAGGPPSAARAAARAAAGSRRVRARPGTGRPGGDGGSTRSWAAAGIAGAARSWSPLRAAGRGATPSGRSAGRG